MIFIVIQIAAKIKRTEQGRERVREKAVLAMEGDKWKLPKCPLYFFLLFSMGQALFIFIFLDFFYQLF